MILSAVTQPTLRMKLSEGTVITDQEEDSSSHLDDMMRSLQWRRRLKIHLVACTLEFLTACCYTNNDTGTFYLV